MWRGCRRAQKGGEWSVIEHHVLFLCRGINFLIIKAKDVTSGGRQLCIPIAQERQWKALSNDKSAFSSSVCAKTSFKSVICFTVSHLLNIWWIWIRLPSSGSVCWKETNVSDCLEIFKVSSFRPPDHLSQLLLSHFHSNPGGKKIILYGFSLWAEDTFLVLVS